jgi:hypothetical protein
MYAGHTISRWRTFVENERWRTFTHLYAFFKEVVTIPAFQNLLVDI